MAAFKEETQCEGYFCLYFVSDMYSIDKKQGTKYYLEIS